MLRKAPVAATLAVMFAIAHPGLARAQAPMVPTALVEEVRSAGAGVEFMDYVGFRQEIRLASRDVLVLSYLRSCEHETITGGTVTVGMERSQVQGGEIVRRRVACDGGRMQLSAQQASQSAASAFRLQNAERQPTLHARTPVVELPRNLTGNDRVLLVERTDRRGERYRIPIDGDARRFYDLARNKVSLTRGATYAASIGTHKVTFRIDAKARSGAAPAVSRLVRFP